MELSKITREDGIACAHLLNALKVARFDNVSGADLEAFVNAKRWVQGLAGQMALALKASAEATTVNPVMKVKSMGSLPSSKKQRK